MGWIIRERVTVRGRNRDKSGFTLVEALISALVLGLGTSAVAGLYFSGLQAMDQQNDRVLLDSAMRSRMELLISTRFDQRTSGSGTVTVGGTAYPIVWTIGTVDLDGDGTNEPAAVVQQMTVTLDGRTLTSVATNHGGRIEKI